MPSLVSIFSCKHSLRNQNTHCIKKHRISPAIPSPASFQRSCLKLLSMYSGCVKSCSAEWFRTSSVSTGRTSFTFVHKQRSFNVSEKLENIAGDDIYLRHTDTPMGLRTEIRDSNASARFKLALFFRMTQSGSDKPLRRVNRLAGDGQGARQFKVFVKTLIFVSYDEVNQQLKLILWVISQYPT